MDYIAIMKWVGIVTWSQIIINFIVMVLTTRAFIFLKKKDKILTNKLKETAVANERAISVIVRERAVEQSESLLNEAKCLVGANDYMSYLIFNKKEGEEFSITLCKRKKSLWDSYSAENISKEAYEDICRIIDKEKEPEREAAKKLLGG